MFGNSFVFYFALSAMLFRFSSDLSLGELYDPEFIFAYLSASLVIYFLATAVLLILILTFLILNFFSRDIFVKISDNFLIMFLNSDN